MGSERAVGAASSGLDWPGKAQARDAALEPVTARLGELREQSLGWDDTANVVIEGDNLTAMRLLHRSEGAGVKLAYLDPPYNLGRDAVYADRLDRTHADWLSMMYPRLLLIRDLLRSDGVVCVSIDDAEHARLRLLCDEVFGEENFVATFTWQTKRAARGVPPRNLLMHNHEYVVCYARQRDLVRFRGLPRSDTDFGNPDGDPRGPWRSESMKATGARHNFFTITDPESGSGYHGNWAFSEPVLNRMIADGRVLFPSRPDGVPRQKKFRNSYTNDTKAVITSLGWHSTERATKALMEMFDGRKVFSFPKPLPVIEFFVEQLVGPGDLVLDPFAGSGTTGHAVLNVNAVDGGRRRFCLVQQAEPLDEASPAQRDAAAVCDQLGRPRTIAELTKERLRRAGAGLVAARGAVVGDVGFRVYEIVDD